MWATPIFTMGKYCVSPINTSTQVFGFGDIVPESMRLNSRVFRPLNRSSLRGWTCMRFQRCALNRLSGDSSLRIIARKIASLSQFSQQGFAYCRSTPTPRHQSSNRQSRNCAAIHVLQRVPCLVRIHFLFRKETARRLRDMPPGLKPAWLRWHCAGVETPASLRIAAFRQPDQLSLSRSLVGPCRASAYFGLLWAAFWALAISGSFIALRAALPWGPSGS